jgi:hypothetical protein
MAVFRTKLQGADGSSATFIAIPEKVMKTFGGRRRVPVTITIATHTYRTTVCDMGLGPMVPVSARNRNAAGIALGDRIEVTIETDLQERTVDVPRDLVDAMNAAHRAAFEKMSFTHRREYVDWVEGAKKPETRARRIEKVVEVLRERLVD